MLLNVVVMSIAMIFTIPLLVIGFELLATLFHKNLFISDQGAAELRGAYKVLMPAHNEVGVIAKTVSSLLQHNVSADDILVVADNCTDATAEIARELGVKVLERVDDAQRGKGYALDHGVNYLKENVQPDVVIVLDADCETNKNSIVSLVNMVMKFNKPVQMTNLMRVVNQTSFSQRIAGFAWLVKNKIRPIAVNKLSLPVTLTGTGMAFPWHVIANINVGHGNIVEDMQLGIDCTLKGFAPIFCEEAVVYSDFPEQLEAEKTQRTRWEHGHLATIIQQVPTLFKQAIGRRDWRLLGLALDIGVPPLSLLVMISLFSGSILSAYSFMTGVYTPLYIFLTNFLFFIGLLVATWWRFGREYLTVKELCGIPVYIISKLSVYAAFVLKRQTSWVKTSRNKKDD